MKAIKNVILSIVTVMVLLCQLMNPVRVRADGETPASPTDLPAEAPLPSVTPEATEIVPAESPTPTNPVFPTAEFPKTIQTQVHTSEPPVETPVTISTPVPPQMDTVKPTVGTPIRLESPTGDISSPPVVDTLIATPIDSNTPIPTHETALEPRLPTSVATSIMVPPSIDTLEPNSEKFIPTQEIISESTLPTSVPAEITFIEQVALLEIIQAISYDTKVIVLDENRQPVPLVSEKAVQVITNSDPVWCPAGQAPTPGENGCTIRYATLGELVANEAGNIAADGTIWITSGLAADANPIVIDGWASMAWPNYSLTLQGGWSGRSGDTIIGSNSVFFVPIVIDGWNSHIVVNSITIEDTHHIDPNSLSFYNGLEVSSNSGNITIGDSNFNNQSGEGAHINTGDGNVTINNSSFSYNDGAGLHVSAPNVTITNSRFNGNGFSGIISTRFTGNFSISNSNFDDNSDSGFWGLTGCESFDLCGDNRYEINLTINDSSFNGNASGGITINLGSGSAIIKNSNFNDNGSGASFTISSGSAMINDSNFNNNQLGAGFYVDGGSVTIRNSNFNNNQFGAWLTGNVTINTSTFGGNRTGVTVNVTDGANISLNNLVIDHNEIGIEVRSCGENPSFMVNRPIFMSNSLDVKNEANCPLTISDATYSTIAARRAGEFVLDCTSVDGYSVNLPNGDLVQIFCPVSGRVRISRLDNTALPADLPAGYIYASAFSLDILQNARAIPVIDEGGFIKASFAAPVIQEGNTYSILYWDQGMWIPLKDFMLDASGNVLFFDLKAGDMADTRKILSGVRGVTTGGSPRVDVSTNFPGIFVLVQH